MQIPTIGFDHKKSDQAEFEIFDLESLYQRENLDHSPQRPHRITFFMMVYTEHGTGFHMVDFKSYPFESGSIVFVRREQVHVFDFSSKPIGKVVIFTQAFLDQVQSWRSTSLTVGIIKTVSPGALPKYWKNNTVGKKKKYVVSWAKTSFESLKQTGSTGN